MGWLVLAGIIYVFFAAGNSKPKKRTRSNKSRSKYSNSTYKSSNSYPRTSAYKPASPTRTKPKQQRKHGSFYSGPLFAAPGTVSSIFGYGSYESENTIPSQFAIVDLETSGLSPSTGRVLEIAVAILDLNGKVTNHFSSLINPQDGNVGRTDIHGISLSDISDAPTFTEISGNILTLFNNSIIVAHNAKFEEKFLAMEFAASNLQLEPMPALDTLWLSQILLELNDYKLHTVMKHFGKDFTNAHTALGDVLAISKILPDMIQMASPIKYPVQLSELPERAFSPVWKSRD